MEPEGSSQEPASCLCLGMNPRLMYPFRNMVKFLR
jgi:hypothetical protein